EVGKRFVNRAITLLVVDQISCEFAHSVYNHCLFQTSVIKHRSFCLAQSQVVPVAARHGMPIAGNSLSNRQIYSACMRAIGQGAGKRYHFFSDLSQNYASE